MNTTHKFDIQLTCMTPLNFFQHWYFTGKTRNLVLSFYNGCALGKLHSHDTIWYDIHTRVCASVWQCPIGEEELCNSNLRQAFCNLKIVSSDPKSRKESPVLLFPGKLVMKVTLNLFSLRLPCSPQNNQWYQQQISKGSTQFYFATQRSNRHITRATYTFKEKHPLE